MSQIFDLRDFKENNYYLISGDGYPNYLSVISNAILDVNNYSIIDKLIIAVDAEDLAFDERHKEIINIIDNKLPQHKYDIIIQTPCLEAWALANKVFIKKNPEDVKLREYLRFYDVRYNDPQYIPAFEKDDCNKAQFCFKYLKRALNDRYRGLTYTKHNPQAIVHDKFFDRIRERHYKTGHISTFSKFLEIFNEKSKV